MIRIEMDAPSVARIRMAASPVAEVVACLELVAAGLRHPFFGDLGPATRFALRDRDVAATAEIIRQASARRFIPDFLTPKPRALPPGAVLDDQLDRVRSTPTGVARAQLTAMTWSTQTSRTLGLDGDALPRVAAAGLAKFWRSVLADSWRGIERMTTDQIVRGGFAAASGGSGALLNSLHRKISWAGNSLIIAKPADRALTLTDTELVIVPSVFTRPRVTVQLDDPDDSFIVVPIRRSESPRPISGRSSSLLGRGRSIVLLSLETLSTTREIAGRIRLGEPTVPYHLHALDDAGLVERTRCGREVRYTLTAMGRELAQRIRSAG